jgi:glutathione-regulated potassium-efflux system protein KefB
MLAAVLSMGGEFAFVVFTEAFRHGLIDGGAARSRGGGGRPEHGAVAAAGAGGGQLAAGEPEKKAERPADAIGHENPRVIIAGFGPRRADRRPHAARRAHPLHRARAQRRASGELAPLRHHDLLRRPFAADLLRARHVDRAEAFVLATDDPEASVRTARLLRRHLPHVKSLRVRATASTPSS